MRFQAITQILLVGLSLVMIFTIVRPMFETVSANQDEIEKFRNAVNTAGMFNARLSELRARAESFSQEDLSALEAYMPAEIDPLSVSRDIVAIVEENGLVLASIEAGESSEPSTDEGEGMMPTDPGMVDPAMDPGMDPAMDPMMGGVDAGMGAGLLSEAEKMLVTQAFTLEVLGTYEQMKELLADLERNAYPLRLISLEFGGSEEGEETIVSDGYTFTLELETYALKSKQ